ncbi:ATP-dependent helicase [Naumannella halotolerans]|uniref:DNA 3'-5' helicase n=1 Tax=Naumannella halotolerans TaxID=993414 RepID=A0A4R7JAP3_9ACTN|nr:ATP-dependent DNA helicase [Naumannella halotolerans]TDT33707.1 superfamily I DNA/RNA helicase [Naumannella halotolerans]
MDDVREAGLEVSDRGRDAAAADAVAAHDRSSRRAGQADGGAVDGQRWELLAPHTPELPRIVPDPTQQVVIDHTDGPLLVLGGPGTGKTATLVEAVAARVAAGEDPGSISVITFSRRAAVALRDRIVRRIGRSGAMPRVFTFHGLSFALMHRFTDSDALPRLLTAPEQEFRVRELLAGRGEADAWPGELTEALPTRGFASQVRAVLARTRQLGLDPDQLAALGAESGRPDWQAVGEFMTEYLDVLDAEGVLDYAELVHRSRILLADPSVQQSLAAEVGRVYVDEFQDTDSAQAQLLLAYAGHPTAGRQCNVVVFGDPDSAVYGFRGADSRGILDFPDLAPGPDGSAAPVLTLGHNHRSGARLAQAVSGVAWRLPLARSLPDPHLLREPVAEHPGGSVEAYSCTTAGAEAEQIAELLRTAHLRDGLAWSQMAVLVRSGQRGIPPLSRALLAAGVPIEVAGDEIPLAAEQAVRTLLLGCQVVAAGQLDADQAHRLLTSPLAGLDSLGVRRLGRALRQAERDELGGGGLPAPTADLVHRALVEPDRLVGLRDSPEVAAARGLADLLSGAAAVARADGTASDVLWELWDGTDWPQRLRSSALGGGLSARRANRDLDSVVALFEVAERASEIGGRRGLAGFLAEVESQQIPADTLREEGVRGAAVRLLTAHRAKGQAWDLVIVAGAQEGLWPDLRRRESLLEPSRLGADGLLDAEPPAARLAAERRLFHLACSRARRRLVVTSVVGTEGEGDQPSRFIGELGVPLRPLAGRPSRPLNLTALVAELRRVAVDPNETPPARDAAVQRLARLAEARDDVGRPLVPAADPINWWGLSAPTESAPAVEPGRITLSGSEVEAIRTCPRRWFLARRARGDRQSGDKALFGSVVHALIEHSDDGRQAQLQLGELDRIWDRMTFDAHWLSAIERAEAEAAVQRWAGWLQARGHRRLLGTEVGFRAEVSLQPSAERPEQRVTISGQVDRLELTGDGKLYVVDYKTSRNALPESEVAGHDQLGIYQLAAQAGAFDKLAPGVRQVAGAELVFLRVQDKQDLPWPTTRVQPSLDDSPRLPEETHDDERQLPPAGPTWVHDRIAEAAAIARSEHYLARPNPGCRHCPFENSCPAKPNGGSVVA